MTSSTNEIELLKEQIKQLISDNLELSARLEYNYDPKKEVRPLTLQEKLDLNMGHTLKKMRISSKTLKSIYYQVMCEHPEPEFIDLTFDENRMFMAHYFVDLQKEKKEIEKGELIDIDVDKVPDDMPGLQQQLDMQQVLNTITDVSNKK